MDALIAKILVPIDFSEGSERAAHYAAALARRLGASVHLVHVLEPAAMAKGSFEFYEPPSRELLDRVYWATRSRLVALASRLEVGLVRVSSEVRHGTPADSISAALVDYGADLVVMSTHGRTGLSHLLMGSVAEQVIHRARCPVLVLRQCGQVHVHRPVPEDAIDLDPVGETG